MKIEYETITVDIEQMFSATDAITASTDDSDHDNSFKDWSDFE